MKKFLKILKHKMEEQDLNAKEVESKFMANFKKEFNESRPSLFDSFSLQHIVAASLLIIGTTVFYNTRDVQIDTAEVAALQILENESLLTNMDVLEELEEFEDLSDEDWEVLIGEVK